MLPSTLTILSENLYLIQGRKQVLKLAPSLEDLAGRTGQLGAMHWLEYFLETPSLANKPPYLVLELRSGTSLDDFNSDNIFAAALFFEYRIGGLCTGIFSTDDAVGFRSVIAPCDDRAGFAERAAQALLRAGGHIILATYETPHDAECAPKPIPGALLGYRQRRVGRMLRLASTFDETLALMGRLTRRNLRYYPRHLAARLPLTFVADARRDLSFAEFMRLNNASLNPVNRERELWLRWRSSCHGAGGFLAGLRSAEGKWLGLIGGWRQETMTVVHWQLNVSGYEHYSIGIVIRSFFLEHEIEHGARKLLMFGGTPHSIRYAFDEDSIADLLLCRPTARLWMLRRLARVFTQHSKRLRKNHLLQTLAVLPLVNAACSSETSSTFNNPSPETSQAS